MVARDARAEIRALAADGAIEWVQRGFEAADIDGHELVIAATDQLQA